MSSYIKVYAIALPIYRYIWHIFIIHVCMYYIWMCIIPVAGSYSDSNLPILFKTFSTPILFAHKPSNSEPMQSPNTAPTKAPLNFERRTFFDMFVLLSFFTISDDSVTILHLVSLYNLPVLLSACQSVKHAKARTMKKLMVSFIAQRVKHNLRWAVHKTDTWPWKYFIQMFGIA